MAYYPYPYSYYPQPAQPLQYPQQSQTGIIWVNSGMEAQAYPVAPNNAVTLWSTAEPVVYLKKADASGKPMLITYDLVERKETPINKEETAYATKDDLSAVADVIAGLKKDLDAVKGDVYGIAGKKKAKDE